MFLKLLYLDRGSGRTLGPSATPFARSDAEPAPGLDRVQEDHDPRLRGEPDHRVDPREVRGIRSRQVARRRERLDAVEGRAVAPAARVRRAQQIHQEGVEPRGAAVGDERGSVLQAQVSDHGLRRVPDDHERRVALIDEIAPAAGDLEGVDEAPGGRRAPVPCRRRRRARCVRSPPSPRARRAPSGTGPKTRRSSDVRTPFDLRIRAFSNPSRFVR